MTTTRTLISTLIVAAAVVGLCSASAAPAASPRVEPDEIVGGWKPIYNVDEPHIQELARWAVSEHDNQTGDRLVLSKVVTGEKQVVEGTNYRLVIQVTKGSAGAKRATYGVELYEKLDKTRQLLTFDPAN